MQISPSIGDVISQSYVAKYQSSSILFRTPCFISSYAGGWPKIKDKLRGIPCDHLLYLTLSNDNIMSRLWQTNMDCYIDQQIICYVSCMLCTCTYLCVIFTRVCASGCGEWRDGWVGGGWRRRKEVGRGTSGGIVLPSTFLWGLLFEIHDVCDGF